MPVAEQRNCGPLQMIEPEYEPLPLQIERYECRTNLPDIVPRLCRFLQRVVHRGARSHVANHIVHATTNLRSFITATAGISAKFKNMNTLQWRRHNADD